MGERAWGQESEANQLDFSDRYSLLFANRQKGTRSPEEYCQHNHNDDKYDPSQAHLTMPSPSIRSEPFCSFLTKRAGRGYFLF